MQGLADGYFVIPYTLGAYIADAGLEKVSPDDQPFRDVKKEVEERLNRLLKVDGKRTVDSFHRALGKIVWDKVGLARNAKGLTEAIEEIRELRAEFWENVKVPGSGEELNQELEKAARVADFLELAELMARDALTREESCGGHFREEYQTEEGEALRDDEKFQHVAVWEYKGDDAEPVRHVEPLVFEKVKPTKRSYK